MLRPHSEGDLRTRWLVSVLTAIMLGYSAWVAQGRVILQERVSALEARYEAIDKSLTRIEDKLDNLLLGGSFRGTPQRTPQHER